MNIVSWLQRHHKIPMLTTHRSEFRPQFTKLDTLRHHFENVPFGACTATCTPDKMTRIRKCLAIRRDAIVIVEGVDRPNLFYGVQPNGYKP